jgi:hypothetical protein
LVVGFAEYGDHGCGCGHSAVREDLNGAHHSRASSGFSTDMFALR